MIYVLEKDTQNDLQNIDSMIQYLNAPHFSSKVIRIIYCI